jgi:hypothetical protein
VEAGHGVILERQGQPVDSPASFSHF